MSANEQTVREQVLQGTQLRDFLQLTKPKVVSLIVFTALLVDHYLLIRP